MIRDFDPTRRRSTNGNLKSTQRLRDGRPEAQEESCSGLVLQLLQRLERVLESGVWFVIERKGSGDCIVSCRL
ncbi:hypothetical protein Mapa_014473 [Marchantia paleacea]|nr:hypothetical protein Mapa_014473 [Marchantia paleacea]